jgi:hypothetical protein
VLGALIGELLNLGVEVQLQLGLFTIYVLLFLHL